MTDALLLGSAFFSFFGIFFIIFRKFREISKLSEDEIRNLTLEIGKEKGFFGKKIVHFSLIILHSSEKFLRKLKILTLRFDNFFARQIVKLKSKSAELKHPGNYFKDLHLWKKEENKQGFAKKENAGIALKDVMDIHPVSPAVQKYLEDLEKKKRDEEKKA